MRQLLFALLLTSVLTASTTGENDNRRKRQDGYPYDRPRIPFEDGNSLLGNTQETTKRKPLNKRPIQTLSDNDSVLQNKINDYRIPVIPLGSDSNIDELIVSQKNIETKPQSQSFDVKSAIVSQKPVFGQRIIDQNIKYQKEQQPVKTATSIRGNSGATQQLYGSNKGYIYDKPKIPFLEGPPKTLEQTKITVTPSQVYVPVETPIVPSGRPVSQFPSYKPSPQSQYKPPQTIAPGIKSPVQTEQKITYNKPLITNVVLTKPVLPSGPQFVQPVSIAKPVGTDYNTLQNQFSFKQPTQTIFTSPSKQTEKSESKPIQTPDLFIQKPTYQPPQRPFINIEQKPIDTEKKPLVNIPVTQSPIYQSPITVSRIPSYQKPKIPPTQFPNLVSSGTFFPSIPARVPSSNIPPAKIPTYQPTVGYEQRQTTTKSISRLPISTPKPSGYVYNIPSKPFEERPSPQKAVTKLPQFTTPTPQILISKYTPTQQPKISTFVPSKSPQFPSSQIFTNQGLSQTKLTPQQPSFTVTQTLIDRPSKIPTYGQTSAPSDNKPFITTETPLYQPSRLPTSSIFIKQSPKLTPTQLIYKPQEFLPTSSSFPAVKKPIYGPLVTSSAPSGIKPFITTETPSYQPSRLPTSSIFSKQPAKLTPTQLVYQTQGFQPTPSSFPVDKNLNQVSNTFVSQKPNYKPQGTTAVQFPTYKFKPSPPQFSIYKPTPPSAFIPNEGLINPQPAVFGSEVLQQKPTSKPAVLKPFEQTPKVAFTKSPVPVTKVGGYIYDKPSKPFVESPAIQNVIRPVKPISSYSPPASKQPSFILPNQSVIGSQITSSVSIAPQFPVSFKPTSTLQFQKPLVIQSPLIPASPQIDIIRDDNKNKPLPPLPTVPTYAPQPQKPLQTSFPSFPTYTPQIIQRPISRYPSVSSVTPIKSKLPQIPQTVQKPIAQFPSVPLYTPKPISNYPSIPLAPSSIPKQVQKPFPSISPNFPQIRPSVPSLPNQSFIGSQITSSVSIAPQFPISFTPTSKVPVQKPFVIPSSITPSPPQIQIILDDKKNKPLPPFPTRPTYGTQPQKPLPTSFPSFPTYTPQIIQKPISRYPAVLSVKPIESELPQIPQTIQKPISQFPSVPLYTSKPISNYPSVPLVPSSIPQQVQKPFPSISPNFPQISQKPIFPYSPLPQPIQTGLPQFISESKGLQSTTSISGIPSKKPIFEAPGYIPPKRPLGLVTTAKPQIFYSKPVSVATPSYVPTFKPSIPVSTTIKPFTYSSSTSKPFVPFSSTVKPFVFPSSTPKPFVPVSATDKPFVYSPSTYKPFVPVSSTVKPFVYSPSTYKPFVPVSSTTKPFVYSSSTSKPFASVSTTAKPFVYSPSTYKPFVPVSSTVKPFVYSPPTAKPFVPVSSTVKPFVYSPSTSKPFAPVSTTIKQFVYSPSTFNPLLPVSTTGKTFISSSFTSKPFVPVGITAKPSIYSPSSYRPSVTVKPLIYSPSTFKPFVPASTPIKPFSYSPSTFKRPVPVGTTANPFVYSPSSYKPAVGVSTDKPPIYSPSTPKVPATIKPYVPISTTIKPYVPFSTTLKPFSNRPSVEKVYTSVSIKEEPFTLKPITYDIPAKEPFSTTKSSPKPQYPFVPGVVTSTSRPITTQEDRHYLPPARPGYSYPKPAIPFDF